MGTSVSLFESRWRMPSKEESRAPLTILLMVLLVKKSSLSLGVAEDSKPAGSSLEMAFLSRCNTKRLGKTARAAGDTQRGGGVIVSLTSCNVNLHTARLGSDLILGAEPAGSPPGGGR